MPSSSARPGLPRGAVWACAVALLSSACGGGQGELTTAVPAAPAVTGVSITPTTSQVAVGQAATLIATVSVTGSASALVLWSSSNNGVASVAASAGSNVAIVTGRSVGTATITATSLLDPTRRGTATITVAEPASPVTVTGIGPNGGLVGGGTTVTVTGTGFAAGASVTLGGQALIGASVRSSTSITATAPAHAAGLVDLAITNPGGSPVTLTGAYNYFSPPTVRWTYDLGARVQDNGSPVVASDGTIFVPSETDFFAVNASGSLRWKKLLSLAGGISWHMRNAPATSPDGSVIYALSSWVTDSTKVSALSAQSGAVLWSYRVAQTVHYSSIVVDGQGAIYLGTGSGGTSTGPGGTLFAVNSSGMLRWRYDTPSFCGAIRATPAVDGNGNVYFTRDCVGGLNSLSSTGSLRWSREGQQAPRLGWPTPRIGPDGTIYVAGEPSNPGIYVGDSTMRAYDPANGSIKWQRADIGWPGFMGGIAVSNDGSTVYSARSGGKLYALNAATGVTRWVTTIADSLEKFGGSIALGTNGVLYVMGNRFQPTPDYVYAVSAATGVLRWSYQLNSIAFYYSPSSPAIAPDGTLIVLSSGNLGIQGGTTSARLYAIVP